jgi:hypothetical protein
MWKKKTITVIFLTPKTWTKQDILGELLFDDCIVPELELE